MGVAFLMAVDCAVRHKALLKPSAKQHHRAIHSSRIATGMLLEYLAEK